MLSRLFFIEPRKHDYRHEYGTSQQADYTDFGIP